MDNIKVTYVAIYKSLKTQRFKKDSAGNFKIVQLKRNYDQINQSIMEYTSNNKVLIINSLCYRFRTTGIFKTIIIYNLKLGLKLK